MCQSSHVQCFSASVGGESSQNTASTDVSYLYMTIFIKLCTVQKHSFTMYIDLFLLTSMT